VITPDPQSRLQAPRLTGATCSESRGIHVAPTAAASAHAAWLQERLGPVPLTVLSWVRLVGDVWLVGTHPQRSSSASADTLVIQVKGSHYSGESVRDYFEESFDAGRPEHPGSDGWLRLRNQVSRIARLSFRINDGQRLAPRLGRSDNL